MKISVYPTLVNITICFPGLLFLFFLTFAHLWWFKVLNWEYINIRPTLTLQLISNAMGYPETPQIRNPGICCNLQKYSSLWKCQKWLYQFCSVLLDMASVEGKFDAFVKAYKCVFFSLCQIFADYNDQCHLEEMLRTIYCGHRSIDCELL